MESLNTLSKSLSRIEKELEKVRGVEYSLPFGSMRRARVSRRWDMLALEKHEVQLKIYSHPDYVDRMRKAEQQTIIDP